MNTLVLTPENNGHTFGDKYNNFVMTLGQDTPDKAPNTKDFKDDKSYYYAVVVYVKKYIESNGYGTVENLYDGKSQFYHITIKLNPETACMGGILVNNYSANKKFKDSLYFSGRSCSNGSCTPIADGSNNVIAAAPIVDGSYVKAVTSLGLTETIRSNNTPIVDWSQRSIVVTKVDSQIYGLDANNEMIFLDNVPKGTKLGYANGLDKGVLTVRTFADVDVFINADSIQYQS